MAQDFAKKKNTSSRKGANGGSIPGWVWLLTGAITGAFIMFLAYLSGLTPLKLNDGKLTESSQLSSDKNLKGQHTEKPTFEFYDSLKNNEIIPPGDPAKNHSPAKGATTEFSYVLQVASFQKPQDADALKAKLTLEGLDTSIQQFSNKGETWYRVLVGPFNDQKKMNLAKTTLAQHNITPIVLQKKPQI